ncbi:MAG TPA: S9 family peptidase, partial [Myxococcota bacterium]|nr:S9 family peptidase [Myxococcota bacterium]
TPDDPEHVLPLFNSPYQGEWPDVKRLNVATGALRPAQAGKPSVRRWYADAAGNVRAGIGYRPDDTYELWARIDPEADFEVAIRHAAISNGETFLGFHRDPAKVYVAKPKDGRDAVYEFDLREKKLGELVFAHSEVDAESLLLAPSGDGRVIGFRYTTDSPQVHFIDAAAAAEHRGLIQALSAEYGQAVQVFPISRSANGAREIVHVSSDTQPPVYYLFDRTTKQLFALIEERPGLGPARLSPTKRVTVRARDGLSIPAYLTLPRGRDPKRVPLIALVHGGPWSRDLIQWDPEVQLFASRGFAVLQMNFRGSTGLGVAHLQAGYREWGQKIQDDITDGVKWAIAEGIADPNRIGIYGASFGGYSALAGAVKTPELYRASAAYAAVTDIELMLNEDRWYDQPYEYAETMVGGERGDKERLRAASPLRHAAEIRVPVLLGHGVDDPTVHVRQSQRMARALREAGKDVAYLEFPDEVHGFLLEANRIRWYEALIAFFEKHLAPSSGGASAPSAGGEAAGD